MCQEQGFVSTVPAGHVCDPVWSLMNSCDSIVNTACIHSVCEKEKQMILCVCMCISYITTNTHICWILTVYDKIIGGLLLN